MELAEVYRIVYTGPDDIIHGLIVCKDEESGYQCLFKDKDFEYEDTDITMLRYENARDQRGLTIVEYPLKSASHLLPNTRINSSIRAKHGFSLRFYMFNDVHNLDFEYPYLHPYELSVPREKIVVSKDGFRYLRVLYAIFSNAVEACLKVMLTNCSDPFYLSGVIAARTSAIEQPAFSSIIFIRDQPSISDPFGENIIIPLSRNIVAVPLEHQLILEFNLEEYCYENHKSKTFVQHYLVFNAKADGKSIESFSCSKGDFKVEVSWRST